MSPTTPQPSYRVIVLGAGFMGALHVEAWAKAGHQIAAVVDIDAERAARLAERCGRDTLHFTQFAEAMQGVSAEIAIVAVPLDQHAPASILALRSGLHVLCEKPVARSLQEVQSIADALRESDRKFAVAFQRNRAVEVNTVRELIESDEIGRPVLWTSDLVAPIRPKRLMHHADVNGGPLVDAAQHYFLLWQTCLGANVQRVSALVGTLAAGQPEVGAIADLAVDTGAVIADLGNGDMAMLSTSWGLSTGVEVQPSPQRIIGPRGVITLSAGFGWGGESVTVDRPGRRTTIRIPPGDCLYDQAIAFARYVSGGDGTDVSIIEDGAELLSISLAVLESAATGDWTEPAYRPNARRDPATSTPSRQETD